MPCAALVRVRAAAAVQALQHGHYAAKQQLSVMGYGHRYATRVVGMCVRDAGEASEGRTRPPPGSVVRVVGRSAGARGVGGMAILCVHSFFFVIVYTTR